MKLGFKRSRSIAGQTGQPSFDDRADSESLVEKDWDEFVIRFDQESRRYRVRTATSLVEDAENKLTAKVTP